MPIVGVHTIQKFRAGQPESVFNHIAALTFSKIIADFGGIPPP
jgi:hypothetical protein